MIYIFYVVRVIVMDPFLKQSIISKPFIIRFSPINLQDLKKKKSFKIRENVEGQ